MLAAHRHIFKQQISSRMVDVYCKHNWPFFPLQSGIYATLHFQLTTYWAWFNAWTVLHCTTQTRPNRPESCISSCYVDPANSQIFQKFCWKIWNWKYCTPKHLAISLAVVLIYSGSFLTLVGLVWHHWADSLSYEYCQPIAWVCNCHSLLASHKNLNTKRPASRWWSCLV